MNIIDPLAQHAQKQPGKSALEFGDIIISFEELHSLVEKCKVRLHKRGVAAGDAVALVLPSTIQHAIVILSVAGLGASIIALPVASTTPASFEKDTAGLLINHVVAVPAAPRFSSSSQISFDELVVGLDQDEIPESPLPNSTSPGQHLLLGQSSGTTGRPKRFFLTHQQTLLRVEESLSVLGYSRSYRYLLGVSLSFFNGVLQVLQRMHMGATLVFPQFRSLEEFVALIIEKKIDFTFALPQRLQQLLQFSGKNQSPLLDGTILLSGSSWLPPRLKAELRKKVTSQICEFYGSNEAGVIAVDLPGEDSPYPDATGRILNTLEAQIVDKNHSPLPAGEIGHIRVRKPKPYLCEQYINNPEASARSFRDGWFYPGDLASISKDGFLFLKGRSDDVINQGGLKMYPLEIETVLLTHPVVLEVAVTSVPDRNFGQVAIAFVCVQGEQTAQVLQDFCANSLGTRIPRRIVFVEEMPRNPAGKILKRVLRSAYLEKLSPTG